MAFNVIFIRNFIPQSHGLKYTIKLNYKILYGVVFGLLVNAHHGTDDTGQIDRASPV